MARSRKISAILSLAVACSLGCSKRSELIGTWREPSASPGPYQSVVAIALARNDATRRVAEDEFVRRLPKGTTGYASYRILTEEEEGDVDKVVAKLKAEGVQAAAVMRLIEENNSVAYDPGSFYRPAYTFQDYYGGVWSTYHDPGYLTTQIAVRIETAFYGVDKTELVWTGYSQTLDPKSSEVVIDDVVRLVVGELSRERLIR